MQDPRIEKIAQVLVEYSVNVQPNDLVFIMGTVLASPMLEAVYRRVLARGGHPSLQVTLPALEEYFMYHASEEQLRFVPPILELVVERYDKFINILGAANTRALTNVPPARQVLRSQASEPIMRRLMERAAAGELQWVLSLFPTPAYAQDAEMSQEEYENFVFGACLPDPEDPIAYWQKLSAFQQAWVHYLADKRTLRVRAEDTDLEMRIEGRPFINCDGKENFPDGEIFTSPIEDSVNGTIRFTYPATYAGRRVENVRLRFENGRVVEAHADKGEEFLLKMLDTDAGARYVGEFAIGTNKGIRQFTGETLFDEKIAGTCHLALGRSYPESGGKNHSAIHWDMVCDLRQGGEIWVDGELIYKDGDFTFTPGA